MIISLGLAGRILFGLLFLIMAFTKMGIIGVLGAYDDFINFMTHFGVPFPKAAFAVSLLLELLGGISILVGYKTRWFCYALAVYLIPVSFFIHFNLGDPIQFVKFVKNFAIIGGLLFIGSVDNLPLSLDSKTNRRTS